MSKGIKYMVLIVQYKEKDEKIIDEILKKFEGSINAKNGQVLCPYKGYERRLITALESILELTRTANKISGNI
ncbi:hypothetical protein J7K06_01725 [Candidatus Bathyarchaeota archaeon]|nr:hypothetical protein [Candidatus Bathyarchaeota archaeon]